MSIWHFIENHINQFIEKHKNEFGATINIKAEEYAVELAARELGKGMIIYED